MRTHTLLPALLILATAAVASPIAPAPKKLETMLQGVSAGEMANLVHAAGGRITHELPVIDAVGAELTREQLNSILESDRVVRYIDDLALADQPTPGPPDPEAQTKCNVAGAVSLRRTPDGVIWSLFNKRTSTAELTTLRISWPATLGKITYLALDETQVPLVNPSLPGDIELKFPAPLLLPADRATQLHIRFERGTGSLRQSDLKLSASFTANCETKLIPGYDENATNFYYTEVTGADALHRQGVRGAGVTVAILDSGLWEHPALANDSAGKPRIPARYDAISGAEVDVAFDESGHGTHLASALAHSGETLRQGKPTGSYLGIAPDARVIPVKAFSENGQGSMLDIVRGIQWVIDNRDKYDIRVLNLSFAARPRWPYFLDPINQAVMRAWQAGIAVVAAAGNEGPEPMTVGSPGNTPYIITVGAVTDSWTPLDYSDDYIPDFSSRGPTPEAHIKPDLVAPGGHITGLIRPGSSLTTEHPEYLLNDETLVLTGSSQAAAIVSGLAALLLQLEPDLTPDDVKCKLLSGADPAINRDGLLAYSPFTQGQGYVNLIRTLLVGERGCANLGLNLEHDLAMEEHFEGPAIVDADGKITLPALSEMLSPTPPAKGHSDERAWGIKAHLERLDPQAPRPRANSIFQWEALYEMEVEKVRALREQPPPQ